MVYVGTRKYKFGRMWLSHMAADTFEELQEMAKKLEINTIHFQDKPKKPHYDICQEKKKKAIELGAKLVNDREIIKMFNKIK